MLLDALSITPEQADSKVVVGALVVEELVGLLGQHWELTLLFVVHDYKQKRGVH